MLVREVFAALIREEVPFVLIGGAALAVYGSTRVSLETDIAIRILDAEKAARVCYHYGCRLVTGVDAEQHPLTAGTVEDALVFVRESRQGFMKFLSALEHLKVMKELSVRTRDDAEKVETDRFDLDFIRRNIEPSERVIPRREHDSPDSREV